MMATTHFIHPFRFFQIAIVLCFGTIPVVVSGQTGKGISYQQLLERASGVETVPTVRRPQLPVLQKAEVSVPLSPVFLPRWSPADLPVFCRIEHEIGKHLPVMVKFRLGSVEYVDQLEGK